MRAHELSVASCLLAALPAAAAKGEETGPSAFDLVVQSYTSTDHCSTTPDNENGIWEPEETVDLSIELGADLGGGYTGIQGTLATDNPGVILLTANAEWPDIPAGESAFSIEPFRLQLAGTVACFEDAGINLALSTDQGSFGPIIIPNVVGAGFEVALPLSIPDITDGTELPMQVYDDVVIEDLDVHLVVDHTWVGDLGFSVRSPAGTEVLLLDRPGVPDTGPFGCSNDDMDITFDDASTFDPENHCPGTTPWYVGDANPVGELSDFNGESTLGTWTLIVTDGGGGDIGDLYNWELLATPGIEGPCNPCGDTVVPAIDARGVFLLALALALGGGVALSTRQTG
jgi:hypothetical protein